MDWPSSEALWGLNKYVTEPRSAARAHGPCMSLGCGQKRWARGVSRRGRARGFIRTLASVLHPNIMAPACSHLETSEPQYVSHGRGHEGQ